MGIVKLPITKLINRFMSDHILLPEGSIEKQTTTLNLGPTHPATHGVFRISWNWMVSV